MLWKSCVGGLVLLFAPTLLASDPRPNILLIVIDTLRYDAASKNNMPFLAELASRGVFFTNAYSTHDFTPPSHFSIMTGLRDGLGTDDDRPENAVPYQLARIGYATFAAVANNLISKKQMPTFRGFREFKQCADINAGTVLDAMNDMTEVDARLAMFNCYPTLHARAQVYCSGERVLPWFLDQIRHAHPPYFGFVNLIDPHEPYIPDPKIYPRERDIPAGFNGDVIARRLGSDLLRPDSIADPSRRAYVKSKIAQAGAASLTAVDLSPETLAIYRNRYNATAGGVDRTLRDFFNVLQREGRFRNTVVIITSDHGESFGEEDLITHMFHDRGNFESTHHVPMLVVLPRSLRGAVRIVDRRVSIASVAPTIYDLAGLNWSAFRARYPSYAPSLSPLFAKGPHRYTSTALLPKPAKQDHGEAEHERQKALESLGYLH